MGRIISGAERDVLRLSDYKIHGRLAYQNIPLEDLIGVNPLLTAAVVLDRDNIVQTGSFTCDVLQGSQSLSPYLTTGAKFGGVPLLTAGQYLDFQIQCTPPGVAPNPGGWRKIFTGLVEELEVDPVAKTIKIDCLDKMARLLWTEMENLTDLAGEKRWGFYVEAGTIEEQLQYILDTAWDYSYGGAYPDNFTIVNGPSGTTATGFWEPPSGPRVNILEAMRRHGMGKNGWDLRGRWDLNGQDSFDLAYYLPYDPTSVSSVGFVRRREGGNIPYDQITKLRWSRRGVRNVVEITPADEARVPVVTENAESIAVFSRAFMAASENRTTHIDTGVEAAILGEIITTSLGKARNTGELLLPFIWFMEINDLFNIGPDGLAFNHGPGGPEFEAASTEWSASHIEYHYDRGKGHTVLAGTERVGSAAGAAWRRWSGQLVSKREYVSLGPPVGPAEEGAVHYQVDDLTPG